MTAIAILFVVALLIEAVVETVHMAVTGGVKWQNLAAIALGIGLAIACKIGIFGALGIAIPMWVDAVVTGILLSRGSNFISDLFDRLKMRQ